MEITYSGCPGGFPKSDQNTAGPPPAGSHIPHPAILRNPLLRAGQSLPLFHQRLQPFGDLRFLLVELHEPRRVRVYGLVGEQGIKLRVARLQRLDFGLHLFQVVLALARARLLLLLLQPVLLAGGRDLAGLPRTSTWMSWTTWPSDWTASPKTRPTNSWPRPASCACRTSRTSSTSRSAVSREPAALRTYILLQ